LYGVLSYVVATKKREIGLRLALGAQPRQVAREVVQMGMVNAAWGVGLGVIVAMILAPAMSSVVFGVRTHDPLTYVVVAGSVAAVAILAALVPGWRAASLNPLDALKHV
jgi:ABC-type antimicrobial peptide transport system permease subunit